MLVRRGHHTIMSRFLKLHVLYVLCQIDPTRSSERCPERSVGALEHRPERLHAVGVGHPPDVIADRMPDGLMVALHAGLGRLAVGVYRRLRFGIALHEIE